MFLWVLLDIWNKGNWFGTIHKIPSRYLLLTLSFPNSPDLSRGIIITLRLPAHIILLQWWRWGGRGAVIVTDVSIKAWRWSAAAFSCFYPRFPGNLWCQDKFVFCAGLLALQPCQPGHSLVCAAWKLAPGATTVAGIVAGLPARTDGPLRLGLSGSLWFPWLFMWGWKRRGRSDADRVPAEFPDLKIVFEV